MIFQHNTSIFSLKAPTSSGHHVICTGDAFNYLHYDARPSKRFGNICSNQFEGDRELFQHLQMEVYNMFGVELNFYKTTYDAKFDRIWGEDHGRLITDYWQVMSFFPLPKEDKVWSKFGIEGMNNFSVVISKLHFKATTNDYHPQIGDIIQTIFDSKLYEIVEVKEDDPMFFLSKKYSWELIVKPHKIESTINTSPAMSASPIAKYYEVSDLFDVRDDVDIEKPDVIYKPDPTERPNDDPFGNW